jgi:hypothetical protein
LAAPPNERIPTSSFFHDLPDPDFAMAKPGRNTCSRNAFRMALDDRDMPGHGGAPRLMK